MSFPVIYIFIAFLMCNMCKSENEWKTVIEGDSVHLDFPYPCNSTRITLQHGIREPFYTLADTESIVLPPLQVHRFTFKKKTKSEQDHYSLHVSINPVKRIDAGTYIFFAYSEDGIYFESSFKTIGLDVDFLPGKASCTLNEEYMVGDWVELNCTALVGSLSGQIECYQNGEKMPPITEPIETYKHLRQSIHVKKNHPVFCCTSSWEHTKDLCECNDFQLDLTNEKNVSSVIDPCGPTTSAHGLMETSETVFTPSKAISTTATTIKMNLNDGSLPRKYVVVFCVGSILITGLAILVIVLILRSRKSKEKSLRYSLNSLPTQDRNLYECLKPTPNAGVNKCSFQHSTTI